MTAHLETRAGTTEQSRAACPRLPRAGEIVTATTASTRPRTVTYLLDRDAWPSSKGRVVLCSADRTPIVVVADTIRVVEPIPPA